MVTAVEIIPAVKVPRIMNAAPGFALSNRVLKAKASVPVRVKAKTADTTTREASSQARVSGHPEGEIRPRWIREDRREDRIPPRAPAFDTSGGTITSSPG